MPVTAPPVLSPSELNIAELSAARLDGDVFSIAGGFCPLDSTMTQALRARAATVGLGEKLIAEQHTAAWILGAQEYEPPALQFCVSSTSRVKSRPGQAGMLLREVVIDDDETVVLGGRRVTSALRTAVDLARSSAVFDPAVQTTVRSLLVLGSHTVDDCAALLDRRRNLPGKVRCLRRLNRC